MTGFSIFPLMSTKHPTYKLNPDSNNKLEKFVKKYLKDGMTLFEKEFEKIDSFVNQAHCEKASNNERDDHSLRCHPKEHYLL